MKILKLLENIASSEFKNFFGQSKVVDMDGNPLKVFHATTQFSGDEFVKSAKSNRTGNPDGFYFASNSDDAESYIQVDTDDNTSEFKQGGHVRLYYLRIEKPYNMRDKPNEKMVEAYKNMIFSNPKFSDAHGYLSGKVESYARNGHVEVGLLLNGTADYTDIIKAGGYDGAKDGRDWIAFESNQIRSVFK